MVKRGISVKAKNGMKFIDAKTLNLTVKTVNIPLLANRRIGKENVLKKDGSYYFDDSFDNKILTFSVEYSDNAYYGTRQFNISKIAKYFYDADELVLNYDSNKVYKVKLISEVNNEMLATYNKFQIQFEAEPIQKHIFHKGYSPKWNEIDIAWNQADFLWGGYQTVFNNIKTNTSIQLENNGTYVVKPTIVLTGTGSSITIKNNTTNESFIYSNLSNETVKIDCENQLVFRDTQSKSNKRMNFNGDYMKLNDGLNDITVTGNWSSLNVEFIYNERYL